MGRALFLDRDLVSTLSMIGASSLLWLIVIGAGSLGNLIGSGVIVLLSGRIMFRCLFRGGVGALPSLAYLCALEPAIRQYTPSVGYLCLEYLIVGAAAFAFLRKRGRIRWNIPFFGLYLALELADLPRASAAAGSATRGIAYQSAAKLGILMLASREDMGHRGTWSVVRAFLIGTTTIASVVAYSILTGKVEWGTQANHTASAGMGPNQIGLILCFGAFAALIAAEFSETRTLRLVSLGLMGYQALCGMMTFSRGPVFALVGCLILYSFPQMARQPAKALRLIVPMLLIALLAWAAVVATGSMIVKRFEEKGVTGRDTIAQGAWEIFLDHPFVGIGTGNFYTESEKVGVLKKGKRTGVHNEIMRTLVEHGLLGAVIFGLFLATGLAQSARGVSGQRRNLCLLLFALSLFSEVYGGLKLSAQVLQLGLACEAFRGPD